MDTTAATETAPPVEPLTLAPEKNVRIPDALWVLDTTAMPLTGRPDEDRAKGRGPRSHAMLVDGLERSITFEPGKALKLPFPLAIKFLKHDAFKRTDEDGNLMPYHRQPKQPGEFGAGEKLVLTDQQTIAEYGELSTMALLQRVIELPGGELLTAKSQTREAMIDFIVKTTLARRKANAAKVPDMNKEEEFIPAPEID